MGSKLHDSGPAANHPAVSKAAAQARTAEEAVAWAKTEASEAAAQATIAKEARAVSAAAAVEPSKPDFELLNFKGETDRYGTTIVGRIRNNTGRQYDSVWASFSLYDEAGEQVGRALASVYNLEPGKVWKFKASGERAATFKLAEIRGY